jgi:ribosomal protein S12
MKFNRVLIEGGRANDLPTVRYTAIRGVLDFAGLFLIKKKRRSIYGARRPDGYSTHVRRKFRHLGYA